MSRIFFYSGRSTVCYGVIQSLLSSPTTFLLTLKEPAPPADFHPVENAPLAFQLFRSSVIPPFLSHIQPMGTFGRPPPKYVLNLFTSNFFATVSLSYLPLLPRLHNRLLKVPSVSTGLPGVSPPQNNQRESLFFIFLATPHSLRDLCSPTRD